MRSQRTAVAAQSSLACLERVLVRRQAEMAGLQAMRVQVRMLQRAPRTTVWPMQNIVVEVPQTWTYPRKPITNHVGADVLICPAKRSSAVACFRSGKNCRAAFDWTDEDICPYVSCGVRPVQNRPDFSISLA